MPYGAHLKLVSRERHPPDLFVCVKYRHETVEVFHRELAHVAASVDECLVIDLRILLSKRLGLPLNIFRLKSSGSSDCAPSLVLYDECALGKYGVTWQGDVQLETWRNWLDFLRRFVLRSL